MPPTEDVILDVRFANYVALHSKLSFSMGFPSPSICGLLLPLDCPFSFDRDYLSSDLILSYTKMLKGMGYYNDVTTRSAGEASGVEEVRG